MVDSRTTEKAGKSISISGYRIDSHGIHDRFLPWRHFGFWKYAKSAKLESTEKTITLAFRFDGRKKPLKIQFGNTFNNALKMVRILESGILHAPSLTINPSTEGILEDANLYLSFNDNNFVKIEEEHKLAKAKLHIRLGHSKAARKETKSLLEKGGEHELAARNIRLHSYLLEADATLARVEYEKISKRFPNNQEACTLWAIWQLTREEKNAEAFAREAIRTSSSLENRLEIESNLVNFLVRKRRYDDALKLIDAHLDSRDLLNPEQLSYANDAKSEIEKLKGDKAYNRKMTVWRPLKAKVIGYGVLALVAIIFLWPAFLETPKLISDWQTLGDLKNDGIPAANGQFRSNLRDLDLGFVNLSFVFSLRGESDTSATRRRLPDHYGSVTLRRSAANAILANTRDYTVIYLPESPSTCTVFPITNENYIGIIANHASAYLMALLLILVALYCFLKEMYKKFKYSPTITG